jgi:two-component system cell cycle sensor histidine kinase/response regulator CckA
MGVKVETLIAQDDRAALGARLKDAVTAGRTDETPLDLRFAGEDGKSASVYLTRLEDADGVISAPILHFFDTTVHRRLEVQFAQSQKMQAVGQLAGGIAHDFNNLLTVMIGFCDLILQRHRPGEQTFADIMQIKQNSNRAANLVRQLLAFSRQQTLQPKVLDVTDVLAELSNLLRRLIGVNITLSMVHGRDLGLVRVDQVQLEQVIINLAVNARDAMKDVGGTLTITTTNEVVERPMRRGTDVMPPGEYVHIDVTDTGHGISPEIVERIFEPFYSTKEVGSGTGLGLSTVYGIVTQTGGFVHVASVPDEGTTFSIYLPRWEEVEGEGEVAEAAARPAANGDLTGEGTVLLVEDEDPVRLFGARALRNKGYTVLEAKNGNSALQVMQETAEPIDLVISDVVMPEMDGPGLIREVRERYPGMKVIFISGYAEDDFRENLERSSGIHFLAKPFSLEQLASKVKQVMAE